ncbi:hypothetical protein GCM10025875_29390 [Litorihabitans aurantiacus]|uniref:DNA helicase n=1 Tax=Litorihabitans aurantiacus TaxID=1930061 RepID=A0AA37XHI9_9MICO|nr:hypothetical protein GCM10025875_29390 [Litorihabitans aurantiacus]
MAAIEPAVALYEEPPTRPFDVATPWADLRLTREDWAEAFAAPEPGTPHNEARAQVWDAIVGVLADQLAEHLGDGDGGLDDGGDDAETPEVPRAALERVLQGDAELRDTLARAWPLLEAEDLVGDLWTVPAYLERCAPSLTPAEIAALQRPDPHSWTTADLPLLDAARRRLGDRDAERRRRAREAATAADRDYRARVTEELVASDDSEMMIMSMLRVEDLRSSLDGDADDTDGHHPRGDELAGPFAHVVVDEAQELTDAEWSMILARCPTRSLTIVGDRAQARHGFDGTWHERLARVGLTRVREATLRVNYRTPSEVMAQAAPVIRAVLPDANVPTSVRESGVPVRFGQVAELGGVLQAWFAGRPDGVACVIASGGAGAAGTALALPDGVDDSRVSVLTPELAKGLEFDLVVLVGDGDDGATSAVDRYVAMTRATQELVVLADA